MQVLIDISTLGLGMMHPDMRGGAYRVDAHLLEQLALSGECELAFCANYSSIFHHGARKFLDTHPELSRFPLLGPPGKSAPSLARGGVAAAYRFFRKLLPHGPLPQLLRSGGKLLDRGIHGSVTDMPGGADIFHSTAFPLPARPQGTSPERFLTIYDLRHRRHPDLYDARALAFGEEAVRSLGPEDWVITSSEASRDELVDWRVAAADRVFVVPLAADRDLFHPCHEALAVNRARARYGIGPAPYILSVNSIDVRKNMHQAVRAFTTLVRQEKLDRLQFVIAGAAGSGSALMQDALAEAGEVRGRIIHTGYIDDADLAPLYSDALAFLYPSIYEGFGLPPLEAMQCGTPVITSNASSLPEVVGEAGIMVPPDDFDALGAAMLRLVTDESLQGALSEASLARAATFNWEATARSVLSAYRAALGSR